MAKERFMRRAPADGDARDDAAVDGEDGDAAVLAFDDDQARRATRPPWRRRTRRGP
jgi:hypothetical protein